MWLQEARELRDIFYSYSKSVLSAKLRATGWQGQEDD